MNLKVITSDGREFVEISGCMVPIELTTDYMEEHIPNRQQEIEDERVRHRLTINNGSPTTI